MSRILSTWRFSTKRQATGTGRLKCTEISLTTAITCCGNAKDEYINVTPNPANPVTTISYSIKSPSNVRLSIYSINGQKVDTLVNSLMSAGMHSASFDGSKYASGVYFYRFESAGLKKSGKFLLLK